MPEQTATDLHLPVPVLRIIGASAWRADLPLPLPGTQTPLGYVTGRLVEGADRATSATYRRRTILYGISAPHLRALDDVLDQVQAEAATTPGQRRELQAFRDQVAELISQAQAARAAEAEAETARQAALATEQAWRRLGQVVEVGAAPMNPELELELATELAALRQVHPEVLAEVLLAVLRVGANAALMVTRDVLRRPTDPEAWLAADQAGRAARKLWEQDHPRPVTA